MKITSFLTTLLISTTALSKPINDECINAIPVDPMSNDIIIGDTTEATIDTVSGNNYYCEGVRLGHGVWYKIKQDIVDLLLVNASLCNDGTNYDTQLTVYKGDDCGNLECVGSYDGGFCSIQSFLVSQAETYYILVHGFSDSKGTFAMTLDSKIVERAVNDECANALAVNPLAGPIVFGDTTGADVDFVSDDNNCGVPVLGPGVWYKFENDMDSLILVTASLCNNETEISPRISVFGGLCQTLSCIGAAYVPIEDVFCSSFNFLADKLSTYYILVHGYSDDRGIFKMTVDGRITEKPSNDECISAIVVDPNAGITLKGDLSGANEDVVPDECGDGSWGEGIHGVWYRVDYVMNDLSLLTASTCNSGTIVDTKISVYKGNDCENLECIGGNNDVGDALCSSYNFLASKPTTFYIYVYGYNNDRDVFELNVDGRSVEQPTNNECVDAIMVDPLANTIVIGDASGSSSVSILGDPYCDGAGEFPGVWYKIKNFMDISYLTSATLCADDIAFHPYLYVFEGDSCDELKRNQHVFGDSDEGCFTFEFLFTASKMYYLFVYGFDQRGSFTLEFNSTIVNKPTNDECANAVIFNPLTETSIVGDTFGANADVPFPNDCYESDGVWFKIDHQVDQLLNLTLFSCGPYENNFWAYKGNDCNSLLLAGSWLEVEFQCQGRNLLLSNRDSYWILISKVFNQGTFAISVESGYPNVLALVDSKTDSVVEALKGYIDYTEVPSSRLNIQASFNPDVNVKSVRVTFDRRSYCEKLSPYSVFGDMFGHFRDVIIPLGSHVVSATSYARPFCVGSAGVNLTKSFEVFGCSYGYEVYDDEFSISIEDMGEDIVLPPLPCQLNIQANVYCGFKEEMVRLELRNNSTNRLIAARNERVVPYTLYNGLGGPLEIGIYNLAVTIDGIKHPKIIFHINDTCFGLASGNLK